MLFETPSPRSRHCASELGGCGPRLARVLRLALFSCMGAITAYAQAPAPLPPTFTMPSSVIAGQAGCVAQVTLTQTGCTITANSLTGGTVTYSNGSLSAGFTDTFTAGTGTTVTLSCSIKTAAGGTGTFTKSIPIVASGPITPMIDSPRLVTAGCTYVARTLIQPGCTPTWSVSGGGLMYTYTSGNYTCISFIATTDTTYGAASVYCTMTNKAGATASSWAPSYIVPMPTAYLTANPNPAPFNAPVKVTPVFTGATSMGTVTANLGTYQGGSDIGSKVTTGSAISVGALKTTKTYWLRVTNAVGTYVDANVTVTPMVVKLSPPSPLAPKVLPGATKAFRALCQGGVSNRVAWSASGGTLSLASTASSESTLWTAPTTPGVYNLTATSVDDPRMTTVTPVTVTALSQTINLNWDAMDSFNSNDATGTSYRFYGNVSALVNIPQAGPWVMYVTNSLGMIKDQKFANLPAGLVAIAISGIDAGNVKLALSVDATPVSFQREELLVVRRDKTTSVEVDFVSSATDPMRYTIDHLSLAQTIQMPDGSIPLIADRKAMVRLRIQDGKTQQESSNKRVVVDIGGPYPRVIDDHTYAIVPGAIYAGMDSVNGLFKPLILDASDVQPGLFVRARLYGDNGALVDELVVHPDIRKGNTIHIHPFSVKLNGTSAGAPVALNSGDFYDQIGKYVESLYPTSRVIVEGGAEVPLPDPGYYPSLPNGGYWKTFPILSGIPPIWIPTFAPEGTITPTIVNLSSVVVLMNQIAQSEGFTVGSQNHLFVGVINGKFYNNNTDGTTRTTGLCTPGAPGIGMFMTSPADGDSHPGYLLSHEMGHAYNLKHAGTLDSKGHGTTGPNAPDENFPYSDAMVAGYGFDSVTDTFMSEETRRHDVMSYHGDIPVPAFSDYFFSRVVTHVGTQDTPATMDSPFSSDPVAFQEIMAVHP